MKTFEYRGFDARGRRCRGLVEALGLKEAREALAAQGVLAERLALSGRRARFPIGSRAVVYRELAALLGAGIPLVRALELLIEAPEVEATHLALAGVRDRVREGAPLADALRDSGTSVSPFEHAVIHAAEESAAMEVTLDRLAAFLDEQEALRSRVQSALIYPAILLTLGLCLAVVMLGVLVPRARDILADGEASMPWLTRMVIAAGAGLFRWGWVAAFLLGSLGWGWAVRLRRDDAARRRWDRALFSVPLWGRGYRILVNLRFARTLAMVLRGGVSVIDGLVLAGRATGSPWVEELAETEARAVRHGGRLSDSVGRIPPLAGSLPGWIRAGEASGGLPRLMESAGDRCQAHWQRFAGRCLGILEPALILLIGAFVLLIASAILLPVVTLSRALVP